MSQQRIDEFTRATRRTTRVATRQKESLLDNDDSYIVSISTKTAKTPVPSSPRKAQNAPEMHKSSPAKFFKFKKPNNEVRNQFYKGSLSEILIIKIFYN